MIDSILLRPLPFPDADRLVTVFNTYPKAGVDRDGSSLTNYYERRGRIPAFSSLAIYRYGTAIVGEAGSTKREQITRVSPDFFATLGVRPGDRTPFHGRGDHVSNRQSRHSHATPIGGSISTPIPHVIGGRFAWTELPNTVVGVLPPGFRFLSSEARLYLPLSVAP